MSETKVIQKHAKVVHVHLEPTIPVSELRARVNELEGEVKAEKIRFQLLAETIKAVVK